MIDQLKGLLYSLKVELLDPVLAKGFPKEDDYRAIDRLVDEIAKRHQESDQVKK